jgi:hypothetical protein
MSDNTHGGKRDGAGRKALEVKKVAVTVRLDPVTVAKLRFICKRRRQSQAAVLSDLIDGEK